MPFDKTWDEQSPPGTESVSFGDDKIRDFKYAIRERLAVEHHFYANETGQTNVGMHKDNTIKTANLQDEAVTTAKIANGAVTSEKLANAIQPLQMTSGFNLEVWPTVYNAWTDLVQLGPIKIYNQALLICHHDVDVIHSVAGNNYKFAFVRNGITIMEEDILNIGEVAYKGCNTFISVGAGDNVVFVARIMCPLGTLRVRNTRFTILYS